MSRKSKLNLYLIVIGIAMVLLIVGTIHLFADYLSHEQGTKETPKVDFELEIIDDNYITQISNVSRTIYITEISWEITDKSGMKMRTGGLEEIYGYYGMQLRYDPTDEIIGEVVIE